MTIVTGIKIAARIYKGYKKGQALERKYRYLDPTNKFIRKYVPPGYRSRAFKIKRYLDIAIGGGLVYDLLDIDFDALLPKKNVRTGKIRQTRNYLVKSRSKRKYTPENCYVPRRKNRR